MGSFRHEAAKQVSAYEYDAGNSIRRRRRKETLTSLASRKLESPYVASYEP